MDSALAFWYETDDLEPGVQLEATGLTLPERLTEAQWLEIGRKLGQAQGRLAWAIGDWWAFGEHKYGDRKALLESPDWTGPSYKTCEIYAQVAKRYKQPTSRLVGLSFAHHQEAVFLPAERRQALLEQAEAKRWSSRTVREQARQIAGKGSEDKAPKTTFRAEPVEPRVTIEAERDNTAEAVEVAEQTFAAPLPEPSPAPKQTAKKDTAQELLQIVQNIEWSNRMIASNDEIKRKLAKDKDMQRRIKRCEPFFDLFSVLQQ